MVNGGERVGKMGISSGSVLSFSPATSDRNPQKTKCCKCGSLLLCFQNTEAVHQMSPVYLLLF